LGCNIIVQFCSLQLFLSNNATKMIREILVCQNVFNLNSHTGFGFKIYYFEEWKTNLISLAFFFTSYVLNMFRTLIYPSLEACNYSVELPHWSYYSWSMCVGVSVWLDWSGILLAGWSIYIIFFTNFRIHTPIGLYIKI